MGCSENREPRPSCVLHQSTSPRTTHRRHRRRRPSIVLGSSLRSQGRPRGAPHTSPLDPSRPGRRRCATTSPPVNVDDGSLAAIAAHQPLSIIDLNLLSTPDPCTPPLSSPLRRARPAQRCRLHSPLVSRIAPPFSRDLFVAYSS